MESIILQVARVGFAVFVVLFCGELFYKAKGDTIVKVCNVGDDIRLDCYPSINEDRVTWYRGGDFFANKEYISNGFVNSRITQEYNDHSTYKNRYTLFISDAEILDSATFFCYTETYAILQTYDVNVIGCTCKLTDHANTDKDKVFCQLENYSAETPTMSIQLAITINGNINKTIHIDRTGSFSFAILRHELHNSLHFELQQLYNNAISNIRCMLPAQFTSPYPSTRYQTTPLIPTTQNEQPEASHTTSQDPISDAAISTTEHHTRKNKNSNQGKNFSDSDITMIIVISGSIFILILIVLIVVLRCKQKKNHQENKHNDILSIDNKDTKEHPEACYESVEDASQRGLRKSTSNEKMRDASESQPNADHHGGMVENILYDSSDKIAEGSISRTEGPLDNALYAMPDKKKTLDRELKSGAVDGSSAADILYGNSVIITQQGQNDHQGGDQYENVEMPGSGGGGNAEEIPLYEMPDKAPQRNTLKAPPKVDQTSTVPKKEVVNVDALYAEVDKTKKK